MTTFDKDIKVITIERLAQGLEISKEDKTTAERFSLRFKQERETFDKEQRSHLRWFCGSMAAELAVIVSSYFLATAPRKIGETFMALGIAIGGACFYQGYSYIKGMFREFELNQEREIVNRSMAYINSLPVKGRQTEAEAAKTSADAAAVQKAADQIKQIMKGGAASKPLSKAAIEEEARRRRLLEKFKNPAMFKD